MSRDSLTGCGVDREGHARPCAEVLDRLIAADRSQRAGQVAAAEALRRSARRFADRHLDEMDCS